MYLKGETSNLFWSWKTVSISDMLLVWGQVLVLHFLWIFCDSSSTFPSLPAIPGCGITQVRYGKCFLGYSVLFLLGLLCWHSFLSFLFSSTAQFLLLWDRFSWIFSLKDFLIYFFLFFLTFSLPSSLSCCPDPSSLFVLFSTFWTWVLCLNPLCL